MIPLAQRKIKAVYMTCGTGYTTRSNDIESIEYDDYVEHSGKIVVIYKSGARLDLYPTAIKGVEYVEA